MGTCENSFKEAVANIVNGTTDVSKLTKAKLAHIENVFEAVKNTSFKKEAEPKDSNTPEFDKLPSYVEGQKNMVYAGIGSRETPQNILDKMKEVASLLSSKKYELRSGGAKGADSAFEEGVQNDKSTKYNNTTIFYTKDATDTTRKIASEMHPNIEAMKESVYKKAIANGKSESEAKNSAQYAHDLQARNTNQIFGDNLDTPVDFVLAWTKDGKDTGGTGQAIRMAEAKGIPVINMYNDDWKEQLNKVMNAKKSTSNKQEAGSVNIWAGKKENMILSNLYVSPFEHDGKKYKSIEHAYQTLKSGAFDKETYDNKSWGTGPVKIAGKKGTNNSGSLKLMTELIESNYKQNPSRQKALLATGNKKLTHNGTTKDDYWTEAFPKILTDLRSKLSSSETSEDVVTADSESKIREAKKITFKKQKIAGYPNKADESKVWVQRFSKAQFKNIGRNPLNMDMIRNFGNPFTVTGLETKGEYSTMEVPLGGPKEVSIMYYNWLKDGTIPTEYDKKEIDNLDSRRDFILSNLDKIKNAKELWYWREPDKYITHVDALVAISEEEAPSVVPETEQKQESSIVRNHKVSSVNDLITLGEEYKKATGNEKWDSSTYQEIFKLIGKAGIKFNPIDIEFKEKVFDENGVEIYGWGTKSKLTLSMDMAKDSTVDPVKVILHEYVHAITISQLTPQRRKQIRAIMDAVLKANPGIDKTGPNGEITTTSYAFTNEEEFLAEALSNIELMEILKSVETSSGSNMWKRAITIFKDLLNMNSDERNALNETIGLIIDMNQINKQKKKPVQTGSKRKTYAMKNNVEEAAKVLEDAKKDGANKAIISTLEENLLKVTANKAKDKTKEC